MRTAFSWLVVFGLLVGACSSESPDTGQATSGTCTPGSPCTCSGDGDCARTCTGAGCDLVCTGNGGCSLSCPQGGCTVACNGKGACSVSSCSDCKCTPSGTGGACL